MTDGVKITRQGHVMELNCHCPNWTDSAGPETCRRNIFPHLEVPLDL